MQDTAPLERLRAIDASAAFDRWCGIEVIEAGEGTAVIARPWKGESASMPVPARGARGRADRTACGFAAATQLGRVLASHYSVNCLRPAVGERFVAKARVVKPGKTQVFTACEVYAQSAEGEKLVATGETLLVPQSTGT